MIDAAEQTGRRRRAWWHAAWAVPAVSGPLFTLLRQDFADSGDWVWAVGMLAFAPTAALLLTLRPGNRVGRILATVAVAAGVVFTSDGIATTWDHVAASVYLEVVSTAAVVFTFWGMLALLFLFPTGETRPGWPRWSFWVFTTGLVGFLPVLQLIRPGPTTLTGRVNPWAVDAAWVEPAIEVGLFSLLGGVVFGVAALVQRYRKSDGAERAQLKLLVLGAGFVVCLVSVIGIVPEEYDTGLVGVLMSLVVILGFWALPGAIVAAVLRYRLYDIDRIASRTVTYLVTVVLLGLGYAGSLVALQTLLPFEGALPVAASTLAMAWVSIPLVRFVQRFVDRRFFRSRYDAQEVVAAFSTVARANLDLEELTSQLTEVVHTTLEPGHVTVWIPPDGE
ncbi:MAG TPA: hypothetical protein VLB67_09050 [Acidimicrobiia bacterium]|nr:hypothetical protein [Acidimicrobiia bacterium]